MLLCTLLTGIMLLIWCRLKTLVGRMICWKIYLLSMTPYKWCPNTLVFPKSLEQLLLHQIRIIWLLKRIVLHLKYFKFQIRMRYCRLWVMMIWKDLRIRFIIRFKRLKKLMMRMIMNLLNSARLSSLINRTMKWLIRRKEKMMKDKSSKKDLKRVNLHFFDLQI